MRNRIIFLKPSEKKLNTMGENVPVYIPFKSSLNNNLIIDEDENVYQLDDRTGNAVLKILNQTPYAKPVSEKDFAVWAYVAPKTGREYEESQKLRSETTYNVITRYHEGITTDMKIQLRDKELKIESVLNVDERNEQLQIVAFEVDSSALLTSSKANTNVSFSHLGGA